MSCQKLAMLSVCAATLGLGGSVRAEVVIEWVVVGDAGNVDDTHGDGFGGVAYKYRLGRYEITNGQYREFLNAVAAVGDPNGL